MIKAETVLKIVKMETSECSTVEQIPSVKVKEDINNLKSLVNSFITYFLMIIED
jgi:hypothetical protein